MDKPQRQFPKGGQCCDFAFRRVTTRREEGGGRDSHLFLGQTDLGLPPQKYQVIMAR